MKKYFISMFVILFVFFALPVYAEISNNSGFIPGQIWYSNDDLVEGETVDIHTAVWNGQKEPLSVKVEFYDKNVILGSRDVVLSALELKDVYVPWKITSGDHIISAKIISSFATISGKKEKITLSSITTENDKKFISAVVKDDEGVAVSSTEVFETQIDNVGSKINDMLPEKISTPISNGFEVVDDFRNEKFIQVSEIKNKTQNDLDLVKESKEIIAKTLINEEDKEDLKTDPIKYIKLFLFTILTFILGNKIVFYGLLFLIVFLILRAIYFKIRNR